MSVERIEPRRADRGARRFEEAIGRELGRHDAPPEQGGRTLVVIAGVHGNERAGIDAARRVLGALGIERPSGFWGRLVVLVGNLAALSHENPHTRYIDHDLNRLFTGEQLGLPPQTSVEHGQMHELLAALRSERARCEELFVIDLHTTSAASRPVVVLEDSIPARRFARRLALPCYLGFEEELGGLLIDRVTSELASIACVIEGGRHDDPAAVGTLEAAIWTALSAAGILDLGAMPHERDPASVLKAAAGDEAGRFYDLRHLHPITRDDFTIAPGVRAGMRIVPGRTVIALEGGEPVTSPVRGRVFLPNMQTHKRAKDDGFFIVRRVGEGWLGFSGRLRRQGWLHHLIAHLPGVFEQGDGTLLVDPDIAAVFKRQLFHLLGYRILRHDRRDGGTGLVRFWRGLCALGKAVARRRTGGGEDDRRFWIVQRHRLDR